MTAMVPNQFYATDGTVGARLGNTSQTPNFTLGQVVLGKGGSRWVYCQCTQAAGITGQGYAAIIDQSTFLAQMATTALGNIGMRLGIAACPWIQNDYGWLQFDGYCPAVQVSASAVAGKLLNTTVTPGVLGTDAAVGSFNAGDAALITANGASQGNQNANLTGLVLGSKN